MSELTKQYDFKQINTDIHIRMSLGLRLKLTEVAKLEDISVAQLIRRACRNELSLFESVTGQEDTYTDELCTSEDTSSLSDLAHIVIGD